MCISHLEHLGAIRLSPVIKQVNQASLSGRSAEPWTITEIHRHLNSLLTYSLLIDFPLTYKAVFQTKYCLNYIFKK